MKRVSSPIKQLFLKDVPFHRKVPKTHFLIDYYKLSVIDSTQTFLTHFHSDHYYGLKKTFTKNIFCSITTANLLKLHIRVEQKFVKEMEMNKTYNIDGADVLCYEANHCPGAVGFIFCVQRSIYLHTGDFRYNFDIHANLHKQVNILRPEGDGACKFDMVFLDNTYENYDHFGSQKSVICEIIKNIWKGNTSKNTLAPVPTKYVFPSYSIGKEKLFLCVAFFFKWVVNVSDKKIKNFNCFSEYTRKELNNSIMELCKDAERQISAPSSSYFSFQCKKGVLKDFYGTPLDYVKTNVNDAIIDVIPFNYVNKQKLNELYGGSTRFKRIVVICGTGWSKKPKFFNFLKDNGTIIKNGIEIHQYSYSEHSSSSELLTFREVIGCKNIIPAVKW